MTQHSSRRWALALVVALFALVLRGATLGTLDLSDPTESRYASVAEGMVLDGNWITPTLPMPEGIVPYLGKPPLHFWLTALSYTLFGINEWASRIPSFVGAISILLSLFLFGRRVLGVDAALCGVFITFSSILFYYFAGSSVVDVTLSAAITASMITFPGIANASRRDSILLGIAVATFTAFGFLIKGPVAPVLVGLGLLFYSLFKRDASELRKFPWLVASVTFLVIITPWFYLSEKASPGFIRYFVWNENIARYLFKNYGDRYGSGHVHPRGASWVMLAIGFLPWTPFLLSELWRTRKEKLNRFETYLLSWALAPVVFFTLVKQLHIGYVLPSIPPLGLFLGLRWSMRKDRSGPLPFSLNIIAVGSLLISLGCLIYMLFVGGNGSGISFVFIVLALAAILLCFSWTSRTSETPLFVRVSQAGAALSILLAVALSFMSGYLNATTSSEMILRQMTQSIPQGPLTIGITTQNTYSHYWLTRSWTKNSDRPTKLVYVDEAAREAPPHLLVKAKDIEKLAPDLANHYEEKLKLGAWVWLEERAPH